jgi:hypothetical protein
LPGGTEKLNEKLIEDSNENNSFQRRFTSWLSHRLWWLRFSFNLLGKCNSSQATTPSSHVDPNLYFLIALSFDAAQFKILKEPLNVRRIDK